MTEDELHDLILLLLDEETARHPEGAKTQEIEEAVTDEVVALLDSLDRDPRAEATVRVHRVATDSRRKRRRVLRTSVEYVVDSFTEDGTYMDPALAMAFPIGTTDGEVKTLRYWTREDFRTSVRMTYRKAAEATEAARAWDETAERAVAFMDAHGWPRFADA